MVQTKEDLTGRNVGRLTVIKQVDDYIDAKGKHYAQWMCRCSCKAHTEIILRHNQIKGEKTHSCGCLRKEVSAETCRNKRKKNKYSDMLEDQYGRYYIGMSSNTGARFFVDAEDYDKIKDYCWSEHIYSSGYHRLVTKFDQKIFAMSEMIGCKYYDHIDRNPLNNRRYNLRPATQQENARNHSISHTNTSGVIGVGWNKVHCKWQSRIYINKKPIFLGWFDDKDDAIKARLLAEYKHFKEFAPQKHLYEQYGIIMEDENDNQIPD